MIILRFKNGKIVRRVTYDNKWTITAFPVGDKLVMTRNVMNGKLTSSFITLEDNKITHYYLNDGNPDSIKIVRSQPINLGNPISGYLELHNTDGDDDNISFIFRDEKTQSSMEFLLLDNIETRDPNGLFENDENTEIITDGVKYSTSETVNVFDASYVIVKNTSPIIRKLISKDPLKVMETLINIENNKYPLVV